MTLPAALQDREFQKFEVGSSDEVRVKTTSNIISNDGTTTIGSTGDSLNVDSATLNLLLDEAIGTFKEINENLKIVIRHLSHITEQDSEKEED